MNERRALREQISGRNSHVGILQALEGFTSQLAGQRVPGAPHSIFQILEHMIYWQDITLARLHQQAPESPKSANLGWQAHAAPAAAGDWEAAVGRLAEGLRRMEQLLTDPGRDLGALVEKRPTSARQELLMIEGHNSYHLGQIVLLRQLLGTWPPPRGGDTW